MKLVIAPPALAELHDAAAFYTLKGNVELGLAFVAEFERAANLVLAKPLRRSCKFLLWHIRGGVLATGRIGNNIPRQLCQ